MYNGIATKKEMRQFVRERNHTIHYHGKARIMYVRGPRAANVVEEAMRAYPLSTYAVRVDGGARSLHPLADPSSETSLKKLNDIKNPYRHAQVE